MAVGNCLHCACSPKNDRAPPPRVALGAEKAVARGYRRAGNCRSCDRYSCLSAVATNLLAEALNARDSLRITLRVGDFSPRSSWLM
jgi:hypothetical protein